jgi:hypothetical protein
MPNQSAPADVIPVIRQGEVPEDEREAAGTLHSALLSMQDMSPLLRTILICLIGVLSNQTQILARRMMIERAYCLGDLLPRVMVR